jgi:hypothetical protein
MIATSVDLISVRKISKRYDLAFYEYSPDLGYRFWLFHSLEPLENFLSTPPCAHHVWSTWAPTWRCRAHRVEAEVKARVAAQLERDKFELEIRAKVDAELKKYSMAARERVSGPYIVRW